MCKVWKTYIHIIHGVNTGKIRNAHRLYTAKPKVIHKVIHRLWIMLITVTRYRVESAKNRTGICTRAADSVDKLWINRKSAHGRHGQRQTGKPRQSGIFPEKTAKIIDFRVDEMGVYEYN